MADDLKARLEAARAERAALAAARAEREKGAATLDQVEAEELAAKIERATIDAEEKHGVLGRGIARVDLYRADGSLLGAVLVRRPHPLIWQKFQAAITDASTAKGQVESEKFWRTHLVWPTAAEVDVMLEQLPACGEQLTAEVAKLAGLRVREVSQK
jgi:hypothetical protein